MPNVKLILKVAGEGGGITMVREEGGKERFRVMMVDQTPTFLNEEEGGGPEIRRDSGWLPDWEAAVTAFSRWPWPALSPRHVDPAFATRVLAAVKTVSDEKRLDMARFGRLERWIRICCEEDALAVLQGHSITYRIALGAHQGRKAFTLQTLPGQPEGRDGQILAQADGFSLHAGVAALATEHTKLERLCRYISRPALSEQRLSLTAQGNVRYQLKTPYRDGTTHVVFEPLDFLARLAALVPTPGVNLTRFHGVFAPHHGLRAAIVPGRKKQPAAHGAVQHGSSALSWAQRLKRVFAIDIERCEGCGGKVKIIARIQDPEVIEKILRHLEKPAPLGQALPRGPPAGTAGLFD